MTIVLNGAVMQVDAACSLTLLLELCGMSGRRIAVEINGDVVPRSAHGDFKLRDGDRVEVIQAIGGG